jgi:hypothetical protein
MGRRSRAHLTATDVAVIDGADLGIGCVGGGKLDHATITGNAGVGVRRPDAQLPLEGATRALRTVRVTGRPFGRHAGCEMLGDGSKRAHLPALLRDTSPGRRLRHPDGTRLLGHRDVATTMAYTHVLNRGPAGVRSPLDAVLDGRAVGVRNPAGPSRYTDRPCSPTSRTHPRRRGGGSGVARSFAPASVGQAAAYTAVVGGYTEPSNRS